MDEKKSSQLTDQEVNAINHYPGAAIDAADDDKVNEKLVDGDTKQLNNNPNNNGKIV